MSQTEPTVAPRVDDLLIGQVPAALFAYPAILVAHERGLFRLLGDGPASLEQVRAGLAVSERTALALVSVPAAAGLVAFRAGRYELSEVGLAYLVRSSPTHWCDYLDFLVSHHGMFSFDSIRRALLEDKPQIHREEIFETHRQDDSEAVAFTRWMHSVSMGPALAWPAKVPLQGHHHMLDVAGGSGAHCIGAVGHWPHLRATVFELASVCAVAREYAAAAGVAERIDTHPGDMWRDPFPAADLHFYSQIFHDWSPEDCLVLAKKSFAALPSGGRIAVHELLFNEDKTGPLRVAAVNVIMTILYAKGRQYTAQELKQILEEAGFRSFEVHATFGHWSVATALKP